MNKKSLIMKIYKNKLVLSLVTTLILLIGFTSKSTAQQRVVCTLEKHIADGYYAAIWYVEDNGDNTYTIQIKIRNDGSGGDLELSHASFEADENTYSDVDVIDQSSNFSYGSIDMGWNLGIDPINGFKVEETEGIGNGDAGWFITEYVLDAPFQDQNVLVKHGFNSDMVLFTASDFQQVLDCMGGNNPPEAVDDYDTTEINIPVSGNVLTNDSDPDGDDLTVTTTPVSDPQHGSVVLNSDGSYTYTPDNGYTGTDTFEYEVCDDGSPSKCDEATVTITIIEGPTAVDDAASTSINTPVDINVLSNDAEGSASLDPTSVSFVAGTEPNPGTEGTFTVNGTTVLVTFTPVTGFTGVVTVDYEVCDDNELCDVATITVTVTGGGGNDSDGDGVDDEDDDYPDDPDRAFDNYYPANGNGTLAYEDLWPGKGDYDFNDLVLDYRFKTVTNASNYVVEIYGKFIIKAFGAGFQNGFGYQLPNTNISPSDINVTGYDLQEGYITLNGNGLESGQTKPTIIVYDNAFNIMPHPGQGIGVNTDPPAPYVDPDTVDIYMDITDNVYTMTQVDIANFNPFIIVDLNRDYEVHLPDYPPTDLADQSIFGTVQDDSDPSNNRYYKTENNLPWAINIYESFDYPIEKREISTAYNYFIEWAESGGISYSDWYQDNPGYRNDTNIY